MNIMEYVLWPTYVYRAYDGACEGAVMTECTAARFGDHDYSQPPHNTPDDPRDAPDKTRCQAQSAHKLGPCQHERVYEIVIYQIATHDWIRMYACTPCTAELRERHARFGPRGTQGIARITLADARA